MLKQVGSPKTVSQPSVQVINEAMRLLSTLGGKRETKNLLNKLENAQTHNQSLIDNAKAIIEEAEQRDKEVTESEAALQARIASADQDIQRRSQELDDLEASIRGQQAEDQERLRRDRNALEDQEAETRRDLEAISNQLDEDRKRLGELDADLVRREEELANNNAEFDEKVELYESQVRELNAEGEKLKELRERLDARDARLKAAMGEGEGGE